MGREDEIRMIAYRIWEEEGCCDGRDCEHWLKAEVIWEKNQKNEAPLSDNKANPKQTRKRDKKDTAASKKR